MRYYALQKVKPLDPPSPCLRVPPKNDFFGVCGSNGFRKDYRWWSDKLQQQAMGALTILLPFIFYIKIIKKIVKYIDL